MPFILALLLALVPVTAAGEDTLCRRLGGSDAISTVLVGSTRSNVECEADGFGCR